MSEFSQPHSPSLDEAAAQELLRSLRQKEGNWLAWGQACQQLQKAGYSPKSIFEETGLETVHQNQIIVAAQVYDSIASELSEVARSRFAASGSDTLYEFRILAQKDRSAAANLAAEKQLDSLDAREIAKAIQEYSHRSQPPAGFTGTAGDAVAYRYWKLARGKKDLQERSRLIARGLQFAESTSAREEVEKLLSDFTVVPSTRAPHLPFYRLESEDELPHLLPAIASLQTTRSEVENLPQPQASEPFGMIQIPQAGYWVALPGWQGLQNATSPIAIACQSDSLPIEAGESEPVLVAVDRGETEWTPTSYFLVERDGMLAIAWFEEAPNVPILGQVLVVLRPKKILDEEAIGDLWDTNE